MDGGPPKMRGREGMRQESKGRMVDYKYIVRRQAKSSDIASDRRANVWVVCALV